MSTRSLDPLEKAVARALAETNSAESPPESSLPDGEQFGNSTPESAALSLPVEAAQSNSDLDYEEVDLDLMASRNIVGHSYGSVEANVFSMLRAQVMHKLQKHGCRSLAVLGPSEGVGKSFITANLALTLAKQRNLSVALLDFDLRKPSIANLFGVERDHCVADYLSGRCSLREIGFRTQLDNLRIYAGQGASHHAAELLTSSRAHRVLKELAPTPNSLVIVDLPPLCGIADVHTFLPNCDAALLVLEYARTSKKEIEESIKLIGSTPLVGSIVNRGRLSTDSTYGYGYGSKVVD